MTTRFNIWLNSRLDELGWSQRELGRRAGLSSAQVSSVLGGKRNVTWDFCAAIAGPLGLHQIDVFQQAGLLKGLTEDEYRLLDYFRGLDPQAKQYLLYAVSTLPGGGG